MKLTTLAFSLSSAAISTAAGINIGDNQSISVPSGQYYGPNGIQKDVVAAVEGLEKAPQEAAALARGGINIGDNQSISVPSGQYYGPSGIQSSNAVQTGSVEAASGASSKDEQDVALLVRGSAGVNAKIEGSLELKQMEDGTSYVYVKNDGDARTFSLHDGVASVKEGSNVNVVGHLEAHGGVSLLAAGNAEAHAVVQQKLEFNSQGMVTNVKFYASAEMTVGISVNGDIPADCLPIEVYKKPTAVAGTAQVSAQVSAGISAHGWSNATMRTVTDYVTYCPEETTITLTTCVSEICNPHEIVVTGETTVTVTGECLIPETSAAKASAAPVAPKSAAPKSPSSAAPKSPSSAAPKAAAPKNNQTSAPQVSSFNGASRNVAGVAGIAGIIAFLI